jgi:DNA-directed RNA polymerase subunit RPC12/RpoP
VVVRYRCRHCGYVLAEIIAERKKWRHWSNKTIVYSPSGARVYNGSLTPQQVVRILGDFCPSCRRQLRLDKYTIVIRCGGVERRREVP